MGENVDVSGRQLVMTTARSNLTPSARGPLALLLVASLLAFLPVCTHEFVAWDDTHNLVRNPHMNPPSLAGAAYYWQNASAHLYIPVTYTIWSILAAVAHTSATTGSVELNPYVFHTFNLLLHLGSATVAYAILRRFTRSGWPACFGAMLFALHPVQVEAVAWVSGMKDVLSGLLSLVAIWQYLSHVRAAQEGAIRQARIAYAWGTLAFVLAMLAKPSAAVLPLCILILDGVFRGIRGSEMGGQGSCRAGLQAGKPARQEPCRRDLRLGGRLVGPVGLWLLLAAPIIVVGKLAQPGSALAFVLPFWARPLVGGDAVAFYLFKLVAPVHLGLDYGRSPQWLWASGQLYFTWAVPVVLGLLALLLRGRLPVFFASFAIFVAALLPVLGLVPFDFQAYSTTADHYLYLAMLGPALLLGVLLDRRPTRTLLAVVGVLLLLLGFGAHLQARTWADSEALFSHALSVNPDSLAGNVNLGNVRADQARALRRAGQADQARARAEQAIALYAHVLKLSPNDFQAHSNLGNMFWFNSRLPEAADHYRAALEILPASIETHTSLGAIRALQKDYDGAIAHFREALRLDPLDPTANKYLAAALHQAATTRKSEVSSQKSEEKNQP